MGDYILTIPFSYESLMEFENSNFNLQDILSEYPNNIRAMSKTVQLEQQFSELKINSEKVTEKVITDKITYNSISQKGEDIEINVTKTTFLPSLLDKKGLELVKTVKTDIACWWCCHQFDTYPVSAPLKYDMKKDVFKVIGCFCSFNCGLAYMCLDKKFTDSSLMSFLHKRITGEYKHIIKSPSKEILEKFGGIVSIQEYRMNLLNPGNTYKLNYYPMIYMTPQLESKSINIPRSLNPKKESVLSKKQISKSIERESTTSKNIKETNLMRFLKKSSLAGPSTA